MRIDILTIFPEIIDGAISHSIVKRAQEKGHVEIYLHNIRDYSKNKQKSVDDYQYGGGAGMVMTIQPIADCINELTAERQYDEIIFMTPDGEVLDQPMCNTMSLGKNLLILCGHYKGVDQRIRDLFITKEISIGSYVLSGGELGAAVLVDAVVRLLPGVLNDETSALTDSFQDNLLAPPLYTRPVEYQGLKVPDVLMSGNHKLIDEWRMKKALEITKAKRPDLLK